MSWANWLRWVHRFNLEDPSILTTRSPAQTTRSSSMARRRNRATLSSLPVRLESTDSASTMKWVHLPRSLWISRSLYVTQIVLQKIKTDHSIGWERSSRFPTFQAGNFPRTNLRSRTIYLQALRPTVDYHKKPEVLPYPREQEFQHCQKYRKEDLQLQYYGEFDDGLHGWASGFHCRFH